MDSLAAQYVLDRDGYSCLICGSDDRIQIAHIRSRGSRPDLKNEDSNLCVLCYNCHMIRQHWWGSVTPQQLEDLMANRYGYEYDRSGNG